MTSSLARHARLALVALALVATATASSALADDDELSEDQRRSRDLYDLGDSHYAAGRYEDAATAFEDGFDLFPHPNFLFNLGNTYERMGDYEKAADFLRRYLESPEAEDVVSIRERIRRLEAAAAARSKAEKAQPLEDDPVDVPDPGAGRQADEFGPRPKTYLYWFGGAGLAFAGAATFGLLASSAASSAEDQCGEAGVCDRGAETDIDSEKQWALAADIGLGVGVVAAGVGLYYLLRAPPRISRDDDESASLELGPMIGPGAVGLTAVGRF